MKQCKSCKETKELDQFYRTGKWYMGSCKKCIMAKSAIYARAHRTEINTWHRKWREGNREHRKFLILKRKQAMSESERKRKQNEAMIKLRRSNPEFYRQRARVHATIQRAIRAGQLSRISEQLCVDCGSQATRYDHYLGYEREHWLDVQPVCSSCDGQREIQRGNRLIYG